MAQQTNIVQRLELKLKEAEDTIQNHLEATKQQQQRNVKSSIEPQSPIRTKRNLEKEHNSKRYQPTPKPSTARSRLRWNDGYHDSEGSGGENRYEEEDETSRFGDLTYEEREVSDEEEEILPTRPSSKSRYRPNMNSKMNQQWVKPSSNSSLQVVSILKDVLINLMNKDQHLEVPPGKKVH